MIEPWTIIAILMLVTGGVEGGMKDTRARPFVLAIRQKITTIKTMSFIQIPLIKSIIFRVLSSIFSKAVFILKKETEKKDSGRFCVLSESLS